LFDKSGIDINELKDAPFNETTKRSLEEIIQLWVPLEKPVTKIRHNLGFHGGVFQQEKNAEKAAQEIDDKKLLPSMAALFHKLDRLSLELEKELNTYDA
jgi:hypothetical protein